MVGDAPATERAAREHPDDRSLDVIFEVLSDQRRRHVLTCLLDHGQAIALSELAADVAGRETGPGRNEVPPHASESRMEVSEDRVQRLTASLYHVHIPKLVAAGVVDYDPDRDVVRPTESARQIEQILALLEPLPSA